MKALQFHKVIRKVLIFWPLGPRLMHFKFFTSSVTNILTNQLYNKHFNNSRISQFNENILSDMNPFINILLQSYATKSKSQGKGDKKSKKLVDLSDDQINSLLDKELFLSQLNTITSKLKEDFVDQLSLKTNIGSLERLNVVTTDGTFPLIQLGQIIQKNPNLIIINMISAPQYINHVKKAIIESGMNLNPQQETTTLYLQIPKITYEHRETLAKKTKIITNKYKERVRSVQNKFIKEISKKKDIVSKDLFQNVNEWVLNESKKSATNLDNLAHLKQKDILGDK